MGLFFPGARYHRHGSEQTVGCQYSKTRTNPGDSGCPCYLAIVAFSQNEVGVHSIEELTATQNGTAEMHVCDVQGFACAYQEGVQTMSDGKVRHAIFMTLLDNTNLIQLVAAIDPDYLDEYQEEVMKMMLSARQ